MSKITRDNIELIQDGEYGLFEGTNDTIITIDEVEKFMSEIEYPAEPKTISIWFDTFQKFYRFSGELEHRNK